MRTRYKTRHLCPRSTQLRGFGRDTERPSRQLTIYNLQLAVSNCPRAMALPLRPRPPSAALLRRTGRRPRARARSFAGFRARGRERGRGEGQRPVTEPGPKWAIPQIPQRIHWSGLWPAEPVAQVSNLLYRGFPTRRPCGGLGLPTGSRRYSRLETCATGWWAIRACIYETKH